MKIKLSKSQWEKIGNESGWMKKEAGKDLGEIGTISLFVRNIKDAGTPNSLPFHLELNFKDMGGTNIDSNSNLKAIFDVIYKQYKNEIDAAYQEGNKGFGKNIKAGPSAPTPPAV